jgi:hypothetical protein
MLAAAPDAVEHEAADLSEWPPLTFRSAAQAAHADQYARTISPSRTLGALYETGWATTADSRTVVGDVTATSTLGGRSRPPVVSDGCRE